MKHHVRLTALFALFAVFAAAGLAGLAFAQEGSKLGMINSQTVLEKSVEGKKAIAQLQAADKKYTDDITRMDDQIKQLQNRLSAQRLTLTPEAAAGIQADVQKKQTDRQRAVEDASRSMQDLQANTLSKVQADLMPLIEQVRKDKGLDLIFDLTKSGAVFFNPALDLTDEVIRRYDATKAAPPVKK
jgi:Skp family chaperone for outer membrane proteins